MLQDNQTQEIWKPQLLETFKETNDTGKLEKREIESYLPFNWMLIGESWRKANTNLQPEWHIYTEFLFSRKWIILYKEIFVQNIFNYVNI